MANYMAATRNCRADRMAKLTDKRDGLTSWLTKAVHNIVHAVMWGCVLLERVVFHRSQSCALDFFLKFKPKTQLWLSVW